MSLKQEKVLLSLQQLALFILTAERIMPTSSPKKLQNVMSWNKEKSWALMAAVI